MLEEAAAVITDLMEIHHSHVTTLALVPHKVKVAQILVITDSAASAKAQVVGVTQATLEVEVEAAVFMVVVVVDTLVLVEAGLASSTPLNLLMPSCAATTFRLHQPKQPKPFQPATYRLIQSAYMLRKMTAM